MNKFNVNKKNVLKVLVGLGVGGVLLLSSRVIDQVINFSDSTNIVQLSNDELLSQFQDGFNESLELKSELEEVYPAACEFIAEYGQYLDQEQLLDTVSTLDTVTLPEEDFTEGVLAEYKPDKNAIYLNERLKYKRDSKILEIKEHELYHYLLSGGFSFNNNNFFHTGLSLDEGIATLLTQESGSFDNTVYYTKNANYVRVICELIGSDNFMSACGNHDLSELTDYLSEYSSKSDAKKLIKLIDEACLDYGNIATDEDIEAWDIINDMYINKNGVSIEDSNDLVMKVYSNKMADTSYEIDNKPSFSVPKVSKNYFLNTDMEPKIIFESGGEYCGEVLLNNSTQYKK